MKVKTYSRGNKLLASHSCRDRLSTLKKCNIESTKIVKEREGEESQREAIDRISKWTSELTD